VRVLAQSGHQDLLARFMGERAATYVFDGEQGYLDHALANDDLIDRVTGATTWAINADEPLLIDYNLEFRQPACATCGPDLYTPDAYRSSDHDPVVVGLSMYRTVMGTAGRDTLLGTAGDDRITGLEGADQLRGGDGADVFVYRSVRDGGDTIADFLPGQDRLDLSALVSRLPAPQGDAGDLISRGHLRLRDSARGLVVQWDADGAAGPGAAITLTTLTGISSSQFNPGRDLMH
jgi:Ca2+-binding RTX toxin-like protein